MNDIFDFLDVKKSTYYDWLKADPAKRAKEEQAIALAIEIRKVHPY